MATDPTARQDRSPYTAFIFVGGYLRLASSVGALSSLWPITVLQETESSRGCVLHVTASPFDSPPFGITRKLLLQLTATVTRWTVAGSWMLTAEPVVMFAFRRGFAEKSLLSPSSRGSFPQFEGGV